MFANRLGKKMAGRSDKRICFGRNINRELFVTIAIMRCLFERNADLA
jgi:hypothetical protein